MSSNAGRNVDVLVSSVIKPSHAFFDVSRCEPIVSSVYGSSQPSIVSSVAKPLQPSCVVSSGSEPSQPIISSVSEPSQCLSVFLELDD